MTAAHRLLAELLAQYEPTGAAEAGDVARARELVAAEPDPWSRAHPLHVTASAFVVHPPSARVLLRWHERQQAWMQVGGHGDPGESDPVQVALREGREECGLVDLVPWPDRSIVHVVVAPVPARGAEAAHEHADVRFVLATSDPQAARPESPRALLRWLTLPDAVAANGEANVRESLARVGRLLAAPWPAGQAGGSS